MGILELLGFSGRKPDVVGRRAFLRGVLTAAPAAVAACAAIDLKFVPELQSAVRDELFKLDQMVEGDLGLEQGRIMVAAPKQIFDPTARVWRSVAAEAGAWADYVSAKTGVKRATVLTACTRLARLVDDDLRAAKVTDDLKIDVRLPEVTRTWLSWGGEKQCEIGLGLHKETLFDGTEQLAVKFKGVPPALVDRNGKKFQLANKGWHDPETKESDAAEAYADDLDDEDYA